MYSTKSHSAESGEQSSYRTFNLDNKPMNTTPSIEPHKIRIAYYDASDGPRIMLFGPMDSDLNSLKSCFLRLSHGECEIELDSLPFVHSTGTRINLVSIDDNDNTRRSSNNYGVRRNTFDNKSFSWTLTRAKWDYLSKLLEGVMQSYNACHQYFSRYPGDDATVVVSKGEYKDDVL